MQYLGNKEIVKEYKVGFLCSRKIPSDIILKTYDWAIAKREAGKCVVSGFHSKIERDVLHYLLKGTQPVIMVLARSLYKRWSDEISQALSSNRLLIITPFSEKVKRASLSTCIKRNKLIISLSDELYIPYMSDTSSLRKLVSHFQKNNIPTF